MHIRDFSGADFDTLSRLLGSLWHSQHGAQSYWCGADELCAYLSHTDKGFVTVDDANSALGALLLDSPRKEDGNDTLKMHWLQQRTRIAAMATALNINARADAAIVYEEDELLKRVGRERGNDGVGVVVLLVLAEQARGQGMGKELLRQGLLWLSDREVRTIRLVTDEDCDWQVYEHLGMERVASQVVSDDIGLTAFVYESPLASLFDRVS